MKEFKEGERVAWNTSGGETTGKIVAKVESSKKVGGHTAKATADNPEYKVESDKTGKQAIHKPDSLNKR